MIVIVSINNYAGRPETGGTKNLLIARGGGGGEQPRGRGGAGTDIDIDRQTDYRPGGDGRCYLLICIDPLDHDSCPMAGWELT
jgi:hypothetical protein